MSNYVKCPECEGTIDSEEAIGIQKYCKACASLHGQYNDKTIEIPQTVLFKLIDMSQTRHPDVARKEAPQFTNLLRKQGILPREK